jgi:hypothetical protein
MRHQPMLLAAAGSLWLTGVGAGFAAIWRYEVTPGDQTVVGRRWPTSSRIGRKPEGFTLVLAVHPQCPCTRATIEGLGRVMGRLRGRLSAYVLVYKPADSPAGWEVTDIWRSAEAIPGVVVMADADGAESGLFQAQTSGLANVYDADGRLVFTGGLTAARGHAGTSAAQEQLVAQVTAGDVPVTAVTKVFGCALPHPAPPSD